MCMICILMGMISIRMGKMCIPPASTICIPKGAISIPASMICIPTGTICNQIPVGTFSVLEGVICSSTYRHDLNTNGHVYYL